MNLPFPKLNIEQEQRSYEEVYSFYRIGDDNSSDVDSDIELTEHYQQFETYLSNQVEKEIIGSHNIKNESIFYANSTVEDVKFDLSSSIENGLNINRENVLRNEFSKLLIQTIRDEDFDFGYISESEVIIGKQLEINALATRNWLNEIFVSYFDDDVVIIGILRILGRFEEEYIFPQGLTMALAALNHKTTEIKELGIRAFENWSSPNSLKILKNIKTDISWLDNYIEQVVTDLNEELCISLEN